MDVGFVYTMRPDGSDVRRLTNDGAATGATWTPEGRILFTSGSGNAPAASGRWTRTEPTRRDSCPPKRSAWPSGTWDRLHPAVAAGRWLGARTAALDAQRRRSRSDRRRPRPSRRQRPSWPAGSAGPARRRPATTVRSARRPPCSPMGACSSPAGCNTAAEVYDPVTGTFSSTGSLAQVRASATATRLHDGRVLFAGGYNCAAAGQDGMWASAELYDPTTGTLQPDRIDGGATLAAHGDAAGRRSRAHRRRSVRADGDDRRDQARLVSDGRASDAFLATAEIYDPTTGDLQQDRFDEHASIDGHTATLLQDGRVLVVGNGGETSTAGKTAPTSTTRRPARSAETGSMKLGRWLHTATLLADGRVLILGGRTPQGLRPCQR